MKSKSCAVDVGQDQEASSTPAPTESWVKQKDELPVQYKVFWFIYTIAANVGLMLTIGYWTVIYQGQAVDIRNISKHVLNSVLMLVDTLVSGVPVRMFHTVYAMAFSALYIVFSVIYWTAGGTNIKGNPYIYKALDWNNISITITVLLPFFLIIITPLMQLVFYGVYRLRLRLEAMINSTSRMLP